LLLLPFVERFLFVALNVDHDTMCVSLWCGLRLRGCSSSEFYLVREKRRMSESKEGNVNVVEILEEDDEFEVKKI
jgi:hypothetical protein